MLTETLEEMVINGGGVTPEQMIVPAETDINVEEYPGNDAQVSDQDRETVELKEPNPESETLNPPVPYSENSISIMSNFQAKTEDDLINHTRFLYHRMESSIVLTYWHIGQSINSFYQKKYGKNELERIANETGIGSDTLSKACRFAKRYTEEQVGRLLNGRVTIAWNHIATNLSAEPEKLIDVYEKSESPEQFNYDIIKFKNSGENRGRKKAAVTEDLQAHVQTDESGEIMDAQYSVEPVGIAVTADETIESDFAADESENTEVARDDSIDLQKEIDMLKLELDARDKRIKELDETVDKVDSTNINLACAISEIRQGLDELWNLMDTTPEIDDVVDKIIDIRKIVNEVMPKR